MSRLDELFEDAMDEINKEKRRLKLIFSGIADYFIGTADENRRHRDEAEDRGPEYSLPYALSCYSGGTVLEAMLFYVAESAGMEALSWTIVADYVTRAGNLLGRREFIGLVGTLRELGYKIQNRDGEIIEDDDDLLGLDPEDEMTILPVLPGDEGYHDDGGEFPGDPADDATDDDYEIIDEPPLHEEPEAPQEEEELPPGEPEEPEEETPDDAPLKDEDHYW